MVENANKFPNLETIYLCTYIFYFRWKYNYDSEIRRFIRV